jgi:hypothetical protein
VDTTALPGGGEDPGDSSLDAFVASETKVFAACGPPSDDGEWLTRVWLARERRRDLMSGAVAPELDVRPMTRKGQLARHSFANSELEILKRLGLVLARSLAKDDT